MLTDLSPDEKQTALFLYWLHFLRYVQDIIIAADSKCALDRSSLQVPLVTGELIKIQVPVHYI